jgi:hypothetical protein
MSRQLNLRALAFLQAMLLLATLVIPALAAAATIQTDLFIYQDGDTVNVAGVDYGANEVVDFVTTDPDGIVVDTGSANSDDLGNIAYSFILRATVAGIYSVVGTGETSGLSASTQFDPVNVTISNSGLTYYKSGANITLSGTYTCSSPQCTTANNVLVEVFLSNGVNNTISGSPVLSATASSFGSGNWSHTFVGGGTSLTDGSKYDVRASLNFTGGTSTSPNRIVKDEIVGSDKTAPSAPVVSGTTPASPANNNSPTVNGTAEGGATVTVYTNGTCSGAPAGSDAANNAGAFSATVSVGNDTNTTFWALATDPAGNASSCSATSITYVEDSTVAPPLLTGSTPPSPSQNTGPSIDGTAEAGATVKLYKNNTCTGSHDDGVAASGSFSIVVSVGNNSTTTFWGTATDLAGNLSGCSSTSVTYNADNNGPSVALNSTPTNPTTSTSANFTFTATDTGASASGVASVACRLDSPTWGACTTNSSFNGTVATGSHTFAVRATDNAGNVGNETSYTWTVNASDTSAPIVSCAAAPSGWQGSEVTIHCTASDVSGVRVGDASFDLSTSVGVGNEDSNASTDSHEVCDLLNNCATAGPITGLQVDLKSPQLTSCDSPDGLWHATDVTLYCHYADGGSGPATQDVALSTSVPAGTETNNALASAGGAYASDNVGNAAASPADIGGNMIDKKAPTVTCVVASFVLNQPGANVYANVTDGGSGAAASPISATANTSTAGTHTVSLTGSDNVGHTTAVTCSYVVGYFFTGFSAPVDRPNTLNVSKAGQAIPLKWQLTDFYSVGVTNVTAVTVNAKDLSCTLGTTTDQVEEYAAGSSGLLNLGGGYYQFNWKTPASYANSCKTIRLDFGGGVVYDNLAYFKFTK